MHLCLETLIFGFMHGLVEVTVHIMKSKNYSFEMLIFSPFFWVLELKEYLLKSMIDNFWILHGQIENDLIWYRE